MHRDSGLEENSKTEIERLQKAIQSAITAGYQIDAEAFEFLSTLSAEDDPTEVVSNALLRIENLEEKPFFIGKDFLEVGLHPSKSEIEKSVQQFVKTEFELIKTEHKEEAKFSIFAPTSPFRVSSKEIASQFEVIEDPTNKISSNGTMEEFLKYFQDRFRRLEKILRQRMDVKAATPISEALKSQPKTKIKIIGMVTEKREAKQQLLLTIEDLNSSATILVPNRAPEEVQKKAQMLLPDQVICVAVSKTRGHLFLAEDIIFPEVGQKQPKRATDPVYAVLTSDIHVGSRKFNHEAFKNFILWLQGKYGNDAMREIADKVKYVLMAGDVVDGIGVYPGQAKELKIRNIYTQYRALASYIERIPNYIEVALIPGDHDATLKALPQPAISKEYAKELYGLKNVHMLADPCNICIHGLEVLMYHGRSLIDVASSVPGVSFNEAYKAMKVLMRSRHLAPTYGERTLITASERDYLVVDRVPDIFHTGHLHLLKSELYRGVLMVNSGCWQSQTEYQVKGGILPTPNVVPVVNLQTKEVTNIHFG
jgi:DNA polymerase II small subunit